ncbi:MAG: peroxide stress protein YaaA [Planctomycetes bacterium]|nr:peroxide stress protein YaaA [Planctomycetota bacterium]
MLVLLSPAKKLDFATSAVDVESTQPRFLNKSAKLIEILKSKSKIEVAELMKLSDALAELNVERYSSWKKRHSGTNAHPSLLCFKGAVYAALDAGTLNKTQLKFANKQVRILSGLYGVLRPFDLIQPYRLEMGTKLDNACGSNLYKFWGSDLSDALNAEGEGVIVNLASNEYFKAVVANNLQAQLITPQFKEKKNGDYKMIGVFAKTARGLMTRYIIENKITNVAQLKKFNDAGYKFNKPLSTATEWVFTRSS